MGNWILTLHTTLLTVKTRKGCLGERGRGWKGGGGGGGGGGGDVQVIAADEGNSLYVKLLRILDIKLTHYGFSLLLADCLTSQQHASVSQGRIRSDNLYVLPH